MASKSREMYKFLSIPWVLFNMASRNINIIGIPIVGLLLHL